MVLSFRLLCTVLVTFTSYVVNARFVTRLAYEDDIEPTSNATITGMSQWKRTDTVFCDNVSKFFCTGGQSCYTGVDGYIGCCSAASCLPRTCIDFTSGFSTSCDYSTGGCYYCNAQSPYCATITNVVASQHVNFCRETPVHSYVSYVNALTTGVLVTYPSSSVPSPALATGPPLPGATFDTSSSVSVKTMPSSTAAPTLVPVGPAESSSVAAAVAAQQVAPSDTGPSPGAIAGIVVGSSCAIVLMLLLWFLLKKLPSRYYPTRWFQQAKTYTPRDVNDNDGHGYGFQPAEDFALAALKSNSFDIAELNSNHHADEKRQGQEHYSPSQPQYRVSNPGPQPASEPTTPTSLTRGGPAEAPTNADSTSPAISALWTPSSTTSSPYMPSPVTDANANANANDPCTPTKRPTWSRLPHNHLPQTPSSIYTPRGLAPSSLQSHGTAPAPSMAQSYSIPELEARGETPGYESARVLRDVRAPSSPCLRGRGGKGAGSPWNYLSAEDALGGGWVNHERSGPAEVREDAEGGAGGGQLDGLPSEKEGQGRECGRKVEGTRQAEHEARTVIAKAG